MKQQKTALITGILGMDGANLANFLLKKDYIVYGCHRRYSSPNYWRLDHLNIKNHPNLKLIECDITDFVSMYNILKDYQPNELYNLASQSHVATSFKQPLYTLVNTGESVFNILEAVRLVSKDTKVYQASSSEIMGSQYDIVDGKKIQNENTRFLPVSPYGVAKLMGHHAIDVYRRSYGVWGCSGILFNHDHELRSEEFVTRKITKWVANYLKYDSKLGLSDRCIESQDDCRNGYPRLRLGNLFAYRDFGYSEDYVEGMWLMLQQEKPDDYVLATSETHTVEEFLIEAFSVGNKYWPGLLGEYQRYIKIDQSLVRPAEVDYLCGDASKAKRVLGWEPKVRFKELVKIMVLNDIKEAKKA